jgi:alkylation response protein AidB-like acyl-CoA dehydrogenase
VLHFGVPMRAPGVTILDTWHTMAMRASGSNDLMLDGVLVPESAISARRPKGAWTQIWNVVVATAGPLVSSAYLGVAEAARELALQKVAHKEMTPTCGS